MFVRAVRCVPASFPFPLPVRSSRQWVRVRCPVPAKRRSWLRAWETLSYQFRPNPPPLRRSPQRQPSLLYRRPQLHPAQCPPRRPPSWRLQSSHRRPLRWQCLRRPPRPPQRHRAVLASYDPLPLRVPRPQPPRRLRPDPRPLCSAPRRGSRFRRHRYLQRPLRPSPMNRDLLFRL